MDLTAIQTLILANLVTWGTYVLAVITATIGVGLAMYGFKFGWNKIKSSLR